VIEHLYTPPVPALRCTASWLEPGGLLVLQTPNAVTAEEAELEVVLRSG